MFVNNKSGKLENFHAYKDEKLKYAELYKNYTGDYVTFVCLRPLYENDFIDAVLSGHHRLPLGASVGSSARPAFDSGDMEHHDGRQPAAGTQPKVQTISLKNDLEVEEPELPGGYEGDENDDDGTRAGDDTPHEQQTFDSSSSGQQSSVINSDYHPTLDQQVKGFTTVSHTASGVESASKWILCGSVVLLLIVFITILSICLICHQNHLQGLKKNEIAVKVETFGREKEGHELAETIIAGDEKKGDEFEEDVVAVKKVVEPREENSVVVAVQTTTNLEKTPEKSAAEETKTGYKKKKRLEKREERPFQLEQKATGHRKAAIGPENTNHSLQLSSLTIPQSMKFSVASFSNDDESFLALITYK
uniref:Uncharacterized protein n=1 Tax=Romanomermis culicivorax TaxID=13658 RepID=A0A915J550_ROMCU